MSSFFDGWRRKLGCVTLLVACVFAAAWIHSNDREEGFWFPVFGSVQGVISSHGTIAWLINNEPDSLAPGWISMELNPDRPRKGQFPRRYFRYIGWNVEYWRICIPVTLLSAYLLLSRPRKLTSGATRI